MSNDEYAKLAGVRSWRPGLEKKPAPAPEYIRPRFDPSKSSLPEDARVVAGMQSKSRTESWVLPKSVKEHTDDPKAANARDKDLGGREHYSGQDGGDKTLIDTFLDDLPTNTRFEKYVVVDGQEQYWFGLLGNPDEFVPKRPGKHLNYAQDNTAGTQLQRMLKDLRKAAPRGWIPNLRGMRVVYIGAGDGEGASVRLKSDGRDV